jgi:hypothetical protein
LTAKQRIPLQNFIGIDPHGPQLKSIKLSPWTHHTPAEKRRTAVMKLDPDSQNQHQRPAQHQKN